MSQPLIVIPSRLNATRLPNKPLADIGGKPMILHVWEKACQSGAGPVVVAAGDPEIKSVIEAAGGVAILTDPQLSSGTDRVAAAANAFDPHKTHEIVVNVQGDLPLLDPAFIRETLKPLACPVYDIATIAAPLRAGEKERSSVVKIALVPSDADSGANVNAGVDANIPDTDVYASRERALCARALYFSRAPIPFGEGGWHHIGLYAYRRPALERMVKLKPSPLEKLENLEQLRAMEAGMIIGVQLLQGDAPLGVDTFADLEMVRARHAG